jgi:hypothetical protein
MLELGEVETLESGSSALFMRSMCNVRREKLGFLRAAHWAPEKTQVSARVAAVIPPVYGPRLVNIIIQETHHPRDASFKGRFGQGKERPSTFVRGHIVSWHP